MPKQTANPSTDEPHWIAALELQALEPGAMTTFKREPHQLVLARSEAGQVYALDNRCPHEGYPLAQGDLKGTSLTCCWHNWKFDLRDGSCQLGGEGCRSYPVRVREGQIEVDLSDPDPAEQHPAWLRSLLEGIFKRDNGRAVRDGIRLLDSGYPVQNLLAEIARDDALRGEYGSTHALPLCADALAYLPRYPGVRAMFAVAPAIDMSGDANRRHPERERFEPLAGANLTEFRNAVESESLARALGLLRGALRDGCGLDEIQAWFYAVLSEHFLNFGHELIYLLKCRDLFASNDNLHAGEILEGLLTSICLGTREDTLPYWKPYRDAFALDAAELGRLYERQKMGAAFEAGSLRDKLLDASSADACACILSALEAGVSADTLAREMVGAAAWRFFRFRVELDSEREFAENWLWATHRFTFASAMRNALMHFPSPLSLRFLFQAAAFIHSGRAMDDEVQHRMSAAPKASTPRAEASTQAILQAIGDRDAERAVELAAIALQDHTCPSELREGLEDLCLRDPLVRPIVVAHAIKTTRCALDEFDALEGHPDRALPLLALVRMLASPIVERRVFDLVHTSMDWVVEGKMQRKLTQ